MNFLRAAAALFKDTALGWHRDRGPLLAAALAYYTILSLAPLLVISVALAGLVFGEAAVEGQLVDQIEGVVGREIGETIQLVIENAASVDRSGELATIIGFILLFLGASGVFSQLKTALNMIWGIAPGRGQGPWGILRSRFLSFTMVVGIGFLLLLSVAISVALAALRRYVGAISPSLVESLPRLDLAAAFILVTILFGIIYRVLPDAEVAWRDVWLGAAVTSSLFALGEYLIGLYLANSSIGSAYGAAGTLLVVLTWIYYSALIFMFGAEFTKVYANRYGSRIRPSSSASLSFPAAPSSATNTIPARLPPIARERRPKGGRFGQVASGLLGLALGLLMAFLSNWRRKSAD
jgi:membrane protein